MKNLTKKFMALGLAVCMTFGSAGAVGAAPKKPATAVSTTKPDKKPSEKPVKPQEHAKIAKATCTSSGKINISFKSQVEYGNNLKVWIKENWGEGKEVTDNAKILKKSRTSMSVQATNLVKGKKYTVVVGDVKKKGAATFENISANFAAKALKTSCKVLPIAKVTAAKTSKVIVKFNKSVNYKDVTVTVRDKNNYTTKYNATIKRRTKGNMEIYIPGLERKHTYTLIIDGIKAVKGEFNYSQVITEFTTK